MDNSKAQLALFDSELQTTEDLQAEIHGKKNSTTEKVKGNRIKEKSHALKAISRYSKLKHKLDNDLTNHNWIDIETDKIKPSKTNFNFVDLFSGAGGISFGFEEAGLNKILSIELKESASETIRRNFPNSIHIHKSIEKVSKEEIEDNLQGKRVDIVCGGPPCNGFSVAGLRNPADPRNKLFKEYIRIVKYLRPSIVVMENVPGLITMEKGGVYNEILDKFADAGYPNMTCRILEAAAYGVPQLRTRAILIGNRHDLPNPYPKEILKKDEYIPIESAIDDLKNEKRDPHTNHEWTDHSKEFEERIAKVLPGESLYKTFRDAFKRQFKGVPSMAVKENHGGCHIHYEKNRVLSAREMARLQTFPDSFHFSGGMKKSYWQIGNAVPCTLAKHIGLALIGTLKEIKRLGQIS